MNTVRKPNQQVTNPKTTVTAQQDNELPTVVTRTVKSQPHATKIKLFGRSEAAREVLIKAETAGTVVSAPIKEGHFIKRGTVVCRQDVNARQAMLDQARAQFKSREVDYLAAQKLVERGFAAETQQLSAQAALDAAKASVKQAEIELDNINIRAPFSGIYADHMAEIGDYLGPGQPCGQLIELDPLKIVVDLTEAQLSLVAQDQVAEIFLATGENVTGTVTFIDSRANPATRTFRTELSVPNKDLSLKAGVTASVVLQGAEENAHLIPGQILSLSGDGEVGVKYLDFENKVRFLPTNTIDETSNGIWVTGLPQTAKIILKGQDFVAVGTEVSPSEETN